MVSCAREVDLGSFFFSARDTSLVPAPVAAFLSLAAYGRLPITGCLLPVALRLVGAWGSLHPPTYPPTHPPCFSSALFGCARVDEHRAKTFRRVLHSVMTVSTQRLLEWQAVMHLSARTADRLTKASSASLWD